MLLQPALKQMKDILKKHWGYTSFLPLQEETILSVLAGRDTLTMLATGGGKSLCFQLPALLKDGLAVVISPLISLMKDQVDSLKDMGIAAECLNSSLPPEEQMAIVSRLQRGNLKLLYISPERLRKEGTISLLKSVSLSFFVIDEAHCISHWGHDFREDYRNLRVIKETFRPVAVHAFTATATEEVQRDILEQLRLENPEAHIGPVDRPNLTYRVRPRSQIIAQVTDLLKKHADEPGIIYCLRRDDVDSLSSKLNELGFRNLPYHAGLTDEARRLHQDQFAREEIDIMVATIAFGMGIDRSNIRFVIHTAMPKSIEHFHQETGRAGRDGLPAYCYLFYGGGDYLTWKSLLEDSPQQAVMLDKLHRLYHFCSQPHCRHKVLANYFGQDYEKASCEACDYCLNELEMVEDPMIVGQKILSCVYRVQQGKGIGFGAGHVGQRAQRKPDRPGRFLGAYMIIDLWHHGRRIGGFYPLYDRTADRPGFSAERGRIFHPLPDGFRQKSAAGRTNARPGQTAGGGQEERDCPQGPGEKRRRMGGSGPRAISAFEKEKSGTRPATGRPGIYHLRRQVLKRYGHDQTYNQGGFRHRLRRRGPQIGHLWRCLYRSNKSTSQKQAKIDSRARAQRCKNILNPLKKGAIRKY